MKKMMNKQISLVLAMLMLMLTAVSAFIPVKAFAQEGNYTLTLTNSGKTDHTFDIYQIFKGDLSEGTLSNIEWGEGIKEDSKAILGEAGKKAETIKDESNAKSFAEEVQEHLSSVKKSISIKAGETGQVTDLEPGYYLVKDTAQSQNKENGAYTSYILKVVKDTEATTKLDVPKVTKEVQENSTKEWGKAADYNIGETIPYRLTGTLPTNYDKYETYKYAFHDEMSQGLTFDKESVKVTIDGQEVNSTDYVLETKDNGFTLTFADLKKLTNYNITKDSKILVEYTAKLNDNAVIGGKGNDNTIYLEYSNNPNKDGDGETGTTPKDRNVVFTYKVIVNKKDENRQDLKGAEFTLFKKLADGGEEEITRFNIKDIMNENGTQFTFKGLDAGKYILKETMTPKGYNTIKDVEFEISAKIEEGQEGPELSDLRAKETKNLGILEFTPNKEEGSVSTDVVNKKGFTLPETGGMGRTIIYVAGFTLVTVSLAYMLISNKRKQAVK